MEPGAAYLHGTSPTEQERLSLLNRLINDAGLREMGLRGGEHIVDFGAGLGQFSAAMAQAGAHVLGIERSQEQLARAIHHERVELRRGDAQEPPLRSGEWGSFDIAHARFLLEHVPDPPAVVRQMVRAVRPGGRIILQDDDHDILRCHPEPAGFAALWRAYERTYDRLQCDPFVGRRLVSLLHEAGAAPARCTFLFFGACAGEPRFPELIENMTGLLRGARDPIVGSGLLGAQEFDFAIEELGRWARRPDAAFWYAIFWAEGVRR
jgi:SAM-dependent methyltransferase